MFLSGVEQTAIGEHTLFGKIFTNGLYTILVLLLPLLILLVLNTCVIHEMRVLKKQRQYVTRTSSKEIRGERSITIVMVTIVLVFLVCHTPDRVFQILMHLTDIPICPSPVFFLSNVSNFLIILNSSTNFLIYYVLRPRFRQIFLMYFCGGCGGFDQKHGRSSAGIHVQLSQMSHTTATTLH